MASFSHNSKIEVLSKQITNDCCALAFLYGIICSTGEVIGENQPTIKITTDIEELFPYINSLLKNLYGEEAKCEIGKSFTITKTVYYDITIGENISKNLLIDCGYYSLEDGKFVREETTKYALAEKCCEESFVKGVFIGCATSSIRISERAQDKTSSGYHLEFASKDENLLKQIADILSSFEISSKMTERKHGFVLYFKEASQVSDILALVGAFNSVLTLQDEIAKRELRNKVNRRINCESANISKTVNASLRQLDAIELIDRKIGLESLSPDLEEVAILRLANPEETLEDLIKLSNIELTKSGLNHRFRKILKIAEELNKNEI